MTLLRNPISHYIQRHSTMSTNCTYLLPCYWRLTFSIHQTPFIYCCELTFLHQIVEKCTSRYPICWKALLPLSYCSFDSYSPTSHLLGLNFFSSGSVGIWITPQSFAIDKGLQNKTSLGWCLRWEDITLLQSISARPYKTSVTRSKIHGTLDAAKHGSLLSVHLHYKRSW